MKKNEKHIVVIKKIDDKLGKKTEIKAVTKKDALDYVKLIKDEEVTIIIFDEDEKIVFSKVKSKNPKYNEHHERDHEHEHHHENHYNHNHGHHHHHHDDDDDSYA